MCNRIGEHVINVFLLTGGEDGGGEVWIGRIHRSKDAMPTWPDGNRKAGPAFFDSIVHAEIRKHCDRLLHRVGIPCDSLFGAQNTQTA